MDNSNLPGWELVSVGLADLEAGRESEAGMLVRIGAPRLRRLGFAVPEDHGEAEFPEHRLYAMLHLRYGDSAHSRYNALVRRLVSFERAASCAR
jgi:hypothetical protein